MDRRGTSGAVLPAPSSPSAAPAAAASSAEPDPPLSLVEDPPPKDLVLEDTAALRKRGVAVGANPITGYNPYDTGPAVASRPAREAATAAAKRTDLRKLSEWIRVQRQVENLKKDGDEGGK